MDLQETDKVMTRNWVYIKYEAKYMNTTHVSISPFPLTDTIPLHSVLYPKEDKMIADAFGTWEEIQRNSVRAKLMIESREMSEATDL